MFVTKLTAKMSKVVSKKCLKKLQHAGVPCDQLEVPPAKPTAGFFGAACARLGIDRADALFVDDAMPNVLGAREAGLAAERDHLSEGVGRLWALWAQHSVPR